MHIMQQLKVGDRVEVAAFRDIIPVGYCLEALP